MTLRSNIITILELVWKFSGYLAMAEHKSGSRDVTNLDFTIHLIIESSIYPNACLGDTDSLTGERINCTSSGTKPQIANQTRLSVVKIFKSDFWKLHPVLHLIFGDECWTPWSTLCQMLNWWELTQVYRCQRSSIMIVSLYLPQVPEPLIHSM